MRQGFVFSPDLFNNYITSILRELASLAGFIIINDIKHAYGTVLMADTEWKLKKILDELVKESKKKRRAINCKKTRCKLRIEDDKIKQENKFKYL